MSAIGPKQTPASAPHMSAFGGKADILATGPSADSDGPIQSLFLPQHFPASLKKFPVRIGREFAIFAS